TRFQDSSRKRFFRTEPPATASSSACTLKNSFARTIIRNATSPTSNTSATTIARARQVNCGEVNSATSGYFKEALSSMEHRIVTAGKRVAANRVYFSQHPPTISQKTYLAAVVVVPTHCLFEQ